MQPIHVQDLARLMGTLVDDNRYEGQTLELGGPDVVTMRELLQAMRQLQSGRSGRMLPLPAGLPAELLWAAERVGLPLPVTAGQLASFVQDGTAADSAFAGAHRDELMPLAAMLQESLAAEGSR